MARCEDFPCCGHENGCCPDYDAAGRQLNMKCLCGATIDINSRSSVCNLCLNNYGEDEDFDCDYDDSMDGDFDSGMRDAGFGTDEDYGYYGENEY